MMTVCGAAVFPPRQANSGLVGARSCAAHHYPVCDPLPTWDWAWVWVALGWPKRGPSVAQGRPKGRLAEVLYLQQGSQNGGEGEEIG